MITKLEDVTIDINVDSRDEELARKVVDRDNGDFKYINVLTLLNYLRESDMPYASNAHDFCMEYGNYEKSERKTFIVDFANLIPDNEFDEIRLSKYCSEEEAAYIVLGTKIDFYEFEDGSIIILDDGRC